MSNRRDVIAALPELPLEPLELGGTLAHARRGPYVTIVPHERPVPAPPPQPPSPAVSRSTYEIREYFTWVTYPVVHCHSPGELLEGLALHDGTTEAPAAQNDLKAIAGKERHYKLSALNGVRFQNPLFCTVRGGPWTAFVEETESCTDGVPNRWELAVYGISGVGMVWYGQWLDQPTIPNLTVIRGSLSLTNVTRQCCAGYNWCPTTQSCIPQRVNCEPAVPA